MDDLAALLAPKIRTILEPYCRKRPRLFLTIGLLKNGRTAILHEGARPVQDARDPQCSGGPPIPSAEPSRPPAQPPIYEIGSITKVFTGALLAKAVRDGRVRLDDPVTEHLPGLRRNPSLARHPVTLRHLATHTSGLPSLPASFLFKLLLSGKARNNPYRHFSKEDMLRYAARFKFPARRAFKYSNLGAGLLGHILAEAYRMDYETALLAEIIRPLGLRDTAIRLSGEQTGRLVPGFDDRHRPASNWDFHALEGAGALRSTAEDLLAFLNVNIGETGHPLEDVLADTHRVLHEEGSTSVGHGWMLERETGVIWHNGGTGGYSGFVGFRKANKTGVAVLANYEHALTHHDSVDGIGFRLLGLLNEG